MRRTLLTSDPKIMMGKPTITGTRITVELILEKLAAGETVDQILSVHPRLQKRSSGNGLCSSFQGAPRLRKHSE